jgi:hypothetical protein
LLDHVILDAVDEGATVQSRVEVGLLTLRSATFSSCAMPVALPGSIEADSGRGRAPARR